MVVPLDEPPAEGQEVDVEVTVDLRLPYMQIAPTKYVTNHATQPPVAGRARRAPDDHHRTVPASPSPPSRAATSSSG